MHTDYSCHKEKWNCTRITVFMLKHCSVDQFSVFHPPPPPPPFLFVCLFESIYQKDSTQVIFLKTFLQQPLHSAVCWSLRNDCNKTQPGCVVITICTDCDKTLPGYVIITICTDWQNATWVCHHHYLHWLWQNATWVCHHHYLHRLTKRYLGMSSSLFALTDKTLLGYVIITICTDCDKTLLGYVIITICTDWQNATWVCHHHYLHWLTKRYLGMSSSLFALTVTKRYLGMSSSLFALTVTKRYLGVSSSPFAVEGWPTLQASRSSTLPLCEWSRIKEHFTQFRLILHSPPSILCYV